MYPNGLTDKQWEQISRFFEGENRGKYLHKHNKQMLYVVKTGYQWRQSLMNFLPIELGIGGVVVVKGNAYRFDVRLFAKFQRIFYGCYRNLLYAYYALLLRRVHTNGLYKFTKLIFRHLWNTFKSIIEKLCREQVTTRAK